MRKLGLDPDGPDASYEYALRVSEIEAVRAADVSYEYALHVSEIEAARAAVVVYTVCMCLSPELKGAYLSLSVYSQR